MSNDFFDGMESLLESQDNSAESYNAEFQRTDKWHLQRIGRITASCYDQIGFHIKKAEGKSKEAVLTWIMQNGGTDLLEEKSMDIGKPIHKLTMDMILPIYDMMEGITELTQTAESYLCSKLAEIATGQSHQFSSAATEHGTEFEPMALAQYKEWLSINHADLEFEEVGFVQCVWNEILGGSPDGLARNSIGIVERAVECKCPYNQANHVKNLKRGGIDSRYIKQALGHLTNTNAIAVDFLSFNPNFPESMRFNVVSINRKDVLIELVQLEADLKLFLEFYLNAVKDFKSKYEDFIVPDFIEKYL